jgi:hypothetical protein
MTNIRDIINSEQLEREFESIRKVFETLKEAEKPLRIEWGTKQAFESQMPNKSRFKKFKVTVKQKRPWVDVDSWFEKPTEEQIIDRFLELLENGRLDEFFEVTIEEMDKNEC